LVRLRTGRTDQSTAWKKRLNGEIAAVVTNSMLAGNEARAF
jgi:hypothetical protein